MNDREPLCYYSDTRALARQPLCYYSTHVPSPSGHPICKGSNVPSDNPSNPLTLTWYYRVAKRNSMMISSTLFRDGNVEGSWVARIHVSGLREALRDGIWDRLRLGHRSRRLLHARRRRARQPRWREVARKH